MDIEIVNDYLVRLVDADMGEYAIEKLAQLMKKHRADTEIRYREMLASLRAINAINDNKDEAITALSDVSGY